jgi:hypothetical protein
MSVMSEPIKLNTLNPDELVDKLLASLENISLDEDIKYFGNGGLYWFYLIWGTDHEQFPSLTNEHEVSFNWDD